MENLSTIDLIWEADFSILDYVVSLVLLWLTNHIPLSLEDNCLRHPSKSAWNCALQPLMVPPHHGLPNPSCVLSLCLLSTSRLSVSELGSLRLESSRFDSSELGSDWNSSYSTQTSSASLCFQKPLLSFIFTIDFSMFMTFGGAGTHQTYMLLALLA